VLKQEMFVKHYPPKLNISVSCSVLKVTARSQQPKLISETSFNYSQPTVCIKCWKF